MLRPASTSRKSKFSSTLAWRLPSAASACAAYWLITVFFRSACFVPLHDGPAPATVPRLSCGSGDAGEAACTDALHTYVARNTPVVVSDAMVRWPASRWTPAWFKQTHGQLEIEVSCSNEEQEATDLRLFTVSAFVDMLKSTAGGDKNNSAMGANQALETSVVGQSGHPCRSPYYKMDQQIFDDINLWHAVAAQQNADEGRPLTAAGTGTGSSGFQDGANEPGASKDPKPAAAPFYLLDAVRTGASVRSALWISPEGAKTGLHADYEPLQLLHQLHGAKRVLMFPPSAAPAMHLSRKWDGGTELSEADVWAALALHGAHPSARPPTAAEPSSLFPLLQGALQQGQYLDFNLSAGQVLYVPFGWWHATLTISTSISVSGKATGRCQTLGAWPTMAKQWLHHYGLYRPAWLGYSCTCHNQDGTAVLTGR